MTFASRKWIGWSMIALLALACSSSSDDVGSTSPTGAGGTSGVGQTVGTTGATVIQSGVTLNIPANALTTNVPITVSMTTTAPSGYELASQVYQFGPSGTTFQQPVAVTIPLTSPDPDVHLFWSNAGGGFDDIGGTVNGTSLTGYVTHFSVGFGAKPTLGNPHKEMDAGAGGSSGAGGATGAGGEGGAVAMGGGSGGGLAGAGGTSAGSGGASAGAGGMSEGTGGVSAGAGGANVIDASAADATSVADVNTGLDDASPTDASTTADVANSVDAGTVTEDATGSGSSDAAVDSGATADVVTSDGASLCAPFGLNLPGAQVAYVDSAAAPDPTTYTGGTLPGGSLSLRTVTHYGSGTYSGTRQAIYTFDTTAQTIQIASFSGFIGMTYVKIAPNKLLATVVCNTGSTNVTSITYDYTASGATVTLTEEGSSDVLVVMGVVS
jgi:hypothetical protein